MTGYRFDNFGGVPHLSGGFIIEDGILYSNVPLASLEYTRNTLEETKMPALFQEALALSLASRLAVPIRDSRELKGDLIKQAENAKQRAAADDGNRQPNRSVTLADQIALARS